MKSSNPILSVLFRAALGLVAFAVVPLMRAQGSGYAGIKYDPSGTALQINGLQLPSTSTYPLTITPSSLGNAASLTVNLIKQLTSVTSIPATANEADALSYVTLSDPSTGADVQTLTFTPSSMSKTVKVTVTFPTGVIPGAYGYKIVTDGWPTTLGFDAAPRSATNLGSDINASVSAPPPTNSAPVVTISQPLAGSVYNIVSNQLSYDVPLQFQATASSNITSVTATLGGANVQLVTSPLNSTSVTGQGTLSVTAAGTYVVTVNATSSSGTTSASSTFTVNVGDSLVPSIIISTSSPQYSLPPDANNVAVPNTFTATTSSGSTLRSWSVTLTSPNGSSVIYTPTPPSGVSSTGSIPLNLTLTGKYILSATVYNDQNKSASATTTFSINSTGAQDLHTVSGVVFLDVANFGSRDANEFGMGGITVNLIKAGSVIQTVTKPDGSFSFTNVPTDTYEVDTVEPVGFTRTDSAARIVSPDLGWKVRDIGLALDLTAIGKMRANGFTIGYWKNNLDKAIAGKTGGTQVSAGLLNLYTAGIRSFGLPVYGTLEMADASAIMGSNSSKPADLLSKQLVAAEYNYQNGAYLNGNEALTKDFVLWGERVLQNSSSLPSNYLIWVKDWFDAYNNTHGGVVGGPGPAP